LFIAEKNIMKVERLYVRHFRNLADQTVELSDAINEVVGGNAQGKTALLEALHLLVLGGSFRTYQLREIIQHGKEGFFVEASVNNGGVRKTIALTYDGSRRIVSIDEQLQESSSLLLGNLLGVTATPEDQELIFGPPSTRRRFLDEQIAQIDPVYVTQLGRYVRALSQRNRLLKARDVRTIGAWEEQLARSGAYIVEQRRKTVDLLSPKVVSTYCSLFDGGNEGSAFSMKYLTQPPEGDDVVSWYQRQYHDRREGEAKVGITLVGPHRDDMEWTMGGRPCRTVASLGQARSVALALRCSEWKLLSERSHETPIFLIDDIENTLDDRRRAVVLDLCRDLGQVVISSHRRQSPQSCIIAIQDGAVKGCC
jgi:DNA replication and repair protein RecF